MAVNRLESRLGIYQRYEKSINKGNIARFVGRKFHDEAYDGMPKTVQQIYDEKLYDTLTICNRSGETAFSITIDKHKDGLDIASIIDKERNKPWSQKKYESYVEISNNLLQSMESRGEEVQYIDDVKGLQSEAKSMVKKGMFITLAQKVQKHSTQLPLNHLKGSER